LRGRGGKRKRWQVSPLGVGGRDGLIGEGGGGCVTEGGGAVGGIVICVKFGVRG